MFVQFLLALRDLDGTGRQRTLGRVAAYGRVPLENVLCQAQECGPGDPFAAGLRQTYNDLDAQRKDILAELAELDAADTAEPGRVTMDAPELLDALPYLALNLALAPQELLRRLFATTQLSVRLHAHSDDVTLTVTLPADYLPEIADTAERINDTMPAHTQKPVTRNRGTGTRVDAVCAPGRIRTCDTRFRSMIISSLVLPDLVRCFAVFAGQRLYRGRRGSDLSRSFVCLLGPAVPIRFPAEGIGDGLRELAEASTEVGRPAGFQ